MAFKLRSKKIQFFRRFLISYIIVLIIPLTLVSITYQKSITEAENDAKKSRLFLLMQTRDMMDTYMRNIDEMAIQIMFNSKLSRLLNMERPKAGSSDIYYWWDYSKEIKNRTLTNNIFKSKFFLFIKNSQTVFSYDGIIVKFPYFYDYIFSYDGMDYSKWYDMFFGQYYSKRTIPAHDVLIDGNNNRVITYTFSINPGITFQNQGAIAFMIEENEILKRLRSINQSDNGWAYVLDGSGQILTGLPNDHYDVKEIMNHSVNTEGYYMTKVYGEKMIVVYAKSLYNEWTYVVGLPAEAVLTKVRYIQTILIVMIALSLLVGLLISYAFAYRNTKPFKDVIVSLQTAFHEDEKAKNEKINEYEFLEGGVSKLINNNKRMQQSIQQQLSTLRLLFFERLLKGEFDDSKKLATLLSYIGLHLSGKAFIVLVLKINQDDKLVNRSILEQLEVLRAYIENALWESVDESCHFHIVNENEMAILLTFNEKNPGYCFEKTKNILENLNKEIKELYHLVPIIGVGDVYEKLIDVHYSYGEARHALNCNSMLKTKSKVIWYHLMKKEEKGYYYPIEVERKLMNRAKAGNKEEIEIVLNKIYTENFINRTLSPNMEKYFFNDMQATLLKLMGELDENEKRERECPLEFYDDHKAVYQNIKKEYHFICKMIQKRMKSHNMQLRDSILEYIDENYSDSLLSVTAIASKYNLSESYFSQYFKEQVGEKFSTYLENLRIRKACELLEKQQLDLERVALKCGYNNAHSFRRAFKRVMGVVPSAYRSYGYQNG